MFAIWRARVERDVRIDGDIGCERDHCAEGRSGRGWRRRRPRVVAPGLWSTLVNPDPLQSRAPLLRGVVGAPGLLVQSRAPCGGGVIGLGRSRRCPGAGSGVSLSWGGRRGLDDGAGAALGRARP
jgi:hypothetical protein